MKHVGSSPSQPSPLAGVGRGGLIDMVIDDRSMRSMRWVTIFCIDGEPPKTMGPSDVVGFMTTGRGVDEPAPATSSGVSVTTGFVTATGAVICGHTHTHTHTHTHRTTRQQRHSDKARRADDVQRVIEAGTLEAAPYRVDRELDGVGFRLGSEVVHASLQPRLPCVEVHGRDARRRGLSHVQVQ
jgi:hypothetical protein